MFFGKVITGDGIGRTLGYPTANLDTKKNEVTLVGGIYAVYATCLGKKYPGALVIQEEPWKVEVYLIDYEGKDCYGSVIEVEPVQKVNELEKIDNVEKLRQKIQSDVGIVRRVLGKNSVDDGAH